MYEPKPDPVTTSSRAAGAAGAVTTTASCWRERLLSWICPAPCLACGDLIGRPQASIGLCAGCHGRLRSWRPSCAVCGRSVSGQTPEGWRCPSCRRHPPPYTRLLAVWRYEPPLDAVVAALKFRRLDYLGARLGHEAFHRTWQRRDRQRPAGCPPVDVVVPVPLHWSRRWGRGFNQAERIAAAVARGLDRPLVDALRRTRRTPPQTRLDRTARLTNPRGAFAARPRAVRQVVGKVVLVVDDVVTTGATLASASRALRRAGARSVVALAVARTE